MAMMQETQQYNIKGDPNKESVVGSGQQQADSTTEQDAWDEERIEEALKTLKEMYIQVRDLRTAIPRLMAPVATKQPSPQILFQEFSKSSKSAMQEVQQLRRLVSNENSVKIFEHAAQSRSQNPKGIKPWRITDDPEWNVRETQS